ncbi:MAG: amino acid permease [Thermaerobacter sp.]|nr:amino acid permease [Thermaerobacter sp.]
MNAGTTSLRKALGWREGAALTIASVLGSGVLYLPALTARLAGPGGLLAWIGMGIMIIPLALTLGQLAVEVPDAGGVAAFARAAFGDIGGTAAGWLFLGTVPVAAPIAALIGAGYVQAALGLGHWFVLPAAALLLAVAVLLNALGVEISGRTATAIVVMIAALLLLAIAVGASRVQAAAFHPFLPHGLAPIGLSTALLFWAFVGWEALAHYAEEFEDPRRDLMRSIVISIVVIDILYLLLAVVTVGTRSYEVGGGVAALAVMLGRGIGSWATIATALLALLVTYGTVHAYVGGFARLVYAQARAGDFPEFFGVLHPGRRTPVRVLVTLAVVFALVFGWDALHPFQLEGLLGWTSGIFIALYVLAMLAALRLLPQKRSRIMAGAALLLCLASWPFLSWEALYPFGLVGVGLLVRWRQESRRNLGNRREPTNRRA